ncbi:MAG: 4Fe-4S binding protein, partial [Planctomycetota bacterium]
MRKNDQDASSGNVAPGAEGLGAELKEYALSMGAELYGVASADDYAKRFPGKPQPTRFVEGASSVVVIGMPFEPGTISTVLRPELAALRVRAADQASSGCGKPLGAERFFMAEENAMIVRELTLIAYRIAKLLRKHGWLSLHVPAGKQSNRFRTAPFYHMPAMYLAGMGTLGLNCSIITPEFGPRAFVTSVITDCPLPHGQPMTQDLCKRCGLCAEHCPINAIDGEGWKN